MQLSTSPVLQAARCQAYVPRDGERAITAGPLVATEIGCGHMNATTFQRDVISSFRPRTQAGPEIC